jgi:hypothetical protein
MSKNTIKGTVAEFHEGPRHEIRDRLIDGLTRIHKTITEVAALYLQAITADPGFAAWVEDETPDVPPSFWRKLEATARGTLDARIAAGGCAWGNKLTRLPIAEQRQAIDSTLPLLTSTGDTLQVRLPALLPSQADQIFAADHIRTLAEQKAWMEAKAAQFAIMAPKPSKGPNIEINRRKGCIVVNGTTLTTSDLLDYLRKLQG